VSGPETNRNESGSDERARYYEEAGSWAQDRERLAARQQRTAWLVAGGAALIAVLEAVAIVVMTPLRTVVPYTLLVDRQTGYVEALKPLERETVTPDRALVRSFLAQYVIARESFDITSLKEDYRKVALWSAGEARDRYIAGMQATNPASPLAILPRQALVTVQINSISSLNADTALVRFTTIRTDPGAQASVPQHWASVLSWKFSGEAMSADDRLINPLGFAVTRYRRDAETLPEAPPPAVAAVPAGPAAVRGPAVLVPAAPGRTGAAGEATVLRPVRPQEAPR